MEPRPVGTQTEPENEKYESGKEENTQENGAEELDETSCETFSHPTGVIAGVAVLMLDGAGLGDGFNGNSSVVIHV